MSLLRTRIATLLLLALFVSNGVMIFAPTNDTMGQELTTSHPMQMAEDATSLQNLTIPYVDEHYGHVDGIIDSTEYSSSYTDPVTGITVYLEHNSTVLYVGLEAATSGWIGFGWKNYTDDYRSEGLNNSDLIYGYAPGTPHGTIERVTASDAITVHYILTLRNGTQIEEGNYPNDDETTPIGDMSLLQGYKDATIGMRIGETKHFILPAEEAYINDPTHHLYGEDLEYVITVTRINNNFINPADSSDIIFSDDYGMSIFQHLPDANQSRIIAADGSDDGTITQLEYSLYMNSTDSEDITLLNDPDVTYPFMLMFGTTEDITELPAQHSDWANPLLGTFGQNAEPSIVFKSPEAGATLGYVIDVSMNLTDDSYIRTAFYKIDDENWTELFYDFESDLWEVSVDLSEYDEGVHTIWVNATDLSNLTATESRNFTIDRPYLPLLGMKLELRRTLTTELFHSTKITDDYNVRNNGSVPINAIEMFLPVEFGSRLLDIQAVDSNGDNLEVVRLENYQGLLHWRIYFYQAVDYDQTYTFTVNTWYHSLHDLVDYDNDLYDVTFPKWPTLPYVINLAEFKLAFRSGDSLPTGTKSPEGTWANLVPMRQTVDSFEMKSFTPLITADRYTEIEIDPWGYMSYHEVISMRNLGPSKESIFLFTLPEYVTSVRIYDEVGILANSQPYGVWDLNSTLDLSINLLSDRFGDDAFWPGYKYTFYIDYTVQVSGHSSLNATGDVLTLPMGTFADCLIGTHTVDVVLSNAIDVKRVSGNYRLLYGVFDTSLRYTVHNTTKHNPPTIQIVYTISPGIVLRPVLFATVIGLFASVMVIFRRLQFIDDPSAISTADDASVDTRQAGAPIELLSEFAKTYSKKVSLNMEMEKLDSSRRRGKITKKEYMIREQDVKDQLQEIDESLPGLKESLLQYGAKYRDLLSQLELQDERIEGAKAGLRQLLLRKKKQRISRAAFEKSRQDYLKTIKKAQTATDRILLTFQEEAGEI